MHPCQRPSPYLRHHPGCREARAPRTSRSSIHAGATRAPVQQSSTPRPSSHPNSKISRPQDARRPPLRPPSESNAKRPSLTPLPIFLQLPPFTGRLVSIRALSRPSCNQACATLPSCLIAQRGNFPYRLLQPACSSHAPTASRAHPISTAHLHTHPNPYRSPRPVAGSGLCYLRNAVRLLGRGSISAHHARKKKQKASRMFLFPVASHVSARRLKITKKPWPSSPFVLVACARIGCRAAP